LLVATLALAAFGAIGVAGTRIQDVWNRDAMNARIGELEDKVQKKGQLINEPLQFQVGSRRIRYELVVNAIDKDRVRGFISATKPVIAADGRQPLGPVIRN
jgi:hypothetical protein